MAGSDLNHKRLLTFSLAAIPINMLLSPVGVILPAFYAKYTAVSLAALGTALLVGRLFDAVTDPLIGYLSDITPGRFGRRRPWMIVGAVIAVVSAYFLFNPDKTAGADYYLLCMLGLYLGYTMLDIPHRAWATELSNDYSTRTRIATFIGVASTLGFVLFLGIPQLPFFESKDIVPSTLSVMGWVIIGAMPLVLITIFSCKESRVIETASPNVLVLVRSLKNNIPFWFYFVAFVTAGIGNGINMVLVYMFLDNYLGIGHVILLSTLCYVVSQLIGLPIGARVAQKIGKHRAWALGQGLYAIFHALVIFLPPGQESFYPFLILTILSGLATSVLMFAPMAILGDIVDYDMLHSKTNRAGAYFALNAMIMKANFAVGGALGLFLVSWIGFDPKGNNSLDTTNWFLLIFIVIPFVLSIISCFVINKFPIDRRKQTILARRLWVLKERGEVV